MTTGSGERGDRLARLIQSRRGEPGQGDSLRDIERRAKDAGYDISHTYIDNLSKRMVVTMPNAEKIAALAAGLQVSEERVKRMAVQDFMGWDPGGMTDDPQDLADLFDAIRAQFAKYPPGERPEQRRSLRNAHYRVIAEWEP